mgnify:CR=1 FL=1
MQSEIILQAMIMHRVAFVFFGSLAVSEALTLTRVATDVGAHSLESSTGLSKLDSEPLVIKRRWGSLTPFIVPDTSGPWSSEFPIDIWALQHICFGVLWAYGFFIYLKLQYPDMTPYKYPWEHPHKTPYVKNP